MDLRRDQGGIPHELQEIVGVRASQVNGCGACVHAHPQNLVKAGQSMERIAAPQRRRRSR